MNSILCLFIQTVLNVIFLHKQVVVYCMQYVLTSDCTSLVINPIQALQLRFTCRCSYEQMHQSDDLVMDAGHMDFGGEWRKAGWHKRIIMTKGKPSIREEQAI